MIRSYTDNWSAAEQRAHHEGMAEFFERFPETFPPNFAAYHRRKLAEIAEGADANAGE
ncbi:hypothetical protein [Salibacterium aidingense]|uniref:hypothetical protein n=1 Tax=Salibacterium aidingense TaxID=384933 RepID=UPI003BBC9380